MADRYRRAGRRVVHVVGVVSDVDEGFFQAEALNGTSDVRGLTLGVRLDHGDTMGRYGAVAVSGEQLTGEVHEHDH